METNDNPIKNIYEMNEFTITLLSPNRAKLTDLIGKWKKECKKAGIVTGVDPHGPQKNPRTHRQSRAGHEPS